MKTGYYIHKTITHIIHKDLRLVMSHCLSFAGRPVGGETGDSDFGRGLDVVLLPLVGVGREDEVASPDGVGAAGRRR